MNPSVKILEVVLQVAPVVHPRHAIDARRGLGLQRPICRPQAIDVDVMQQRREPRFLVFHCDSSHTIQRMLHVQSGAVSGTRCAGRVPLGRSPFLDRLRDRSRGVVRRRRRYYGTV